eukprot:scaffold76765_cov59-Phaeocystis_antarctica.AAC.2
MSTAERPPGGAGCPGGGGGPRSSARSTSNGRPSCPTARPTRSGVGLQSAAKTLCTCTASPRVGSSTRARRRGTTRPSSCCTTGRAKASVLPLPVGAETRTSPPQPHACAARTRGTTVLCTGKQRRTPIAASAPTSRGSRSRSSSGLVASPMTVACAWRIQSGRSDSSATSAGSMESSAAASSVEGSGSSAGVASTAEPLPAGAELLPAAVLATTWPSGEASRMAGAVAVEGKPSSPLKGSSSSSLVPSSSTKGMVCARAVRRKLEGTVADDDRRHKQTRTQTDNAHLTEDKGIERRIAACGSTCTCTTSTCGVWSCVTKSLTFYGARFLRFHHAQNLEKLRSTRLRSHMCIKHYMHLAIT